MNPNLQKFLLLALLIFGAALLGIFLWTSPPPILTSRAGLFFSELRAQFAGDWQFPKHAAMGVFTVLVMWFAAAGFGMHLLARTGAAESLPSFWQRLVFAVLTGWVALGLGVLALGLIGLCNRLALGSLLAVTAALGIPGWRVLMAGMAAQYLEADESEEGGDAETPEPDEPEVRVEPAEPEAVLSGRLLLLVLLVYLIAVPYAATPAVESDELRYHLAAPEAWLEAGRIHYLPHQANSNFPFLIEMLFTLAMGLQGTEAARLVHLSLLESSAVLTGLICFMLIALSFGRGVRRSRAAFGTAALAGAAFALVPSATILACWAFVDIATTAYFLAVIYLGALALTARRPPPAWLLGLMAGGAMGTKYSMLPVMAGLGVGLAALLWASGWPWRFGGGGLRRYATVAALTAAAVASPWFLKNLAWTGNPVYPLAWSLFDGGEWSETNAQFYAAKGAEKGVRLDRLTERLDRQTEFDVPRLPSNRALELLVSPLTVTFFGEAFEGHFLGPVPLAALAAALVGLILGHGLRRRGQGPERLLVLWLYGALAFFWVVWFFSYQSIRLLLPGVALTLALGGWGCALAAGLPAGGGRPGRGGRALAALAAAAVLYSWLWTMTTVTVGKAPRPLPVAAGVTAREDYLSRALNYYDSARWLSARLGPERRALLIGEHRTLYFSRHVVASDWFDTPQPLPWIRATADNDALFARLRAEGVRYVYLNADELGKYAAAYFRPRFTEAEYRRFEAFLADDRLAEIHRDDSGPAPIVVYEIREGGDLDKMINR